MMDVQAQKARAELSEIKSQLAEVRDKHRQQVSGIKEDLEAQKKAANAAARALREQGEYAKALEAQAVVMRAYLADRDSMPRRIAVDFGAGLAGTAASVAQDKVYDYVVAPKAGEKPGTTVTHAKLIKGILKITEGGVIYFSGLDSAQKPPTMGDEMQIEIGKVLAQQGTAHVLDYVADELLAWYKSWRAKKG